MTLSAGERLGPYEIVALIGKGGMGEVWKARDTRLGREVAIKVSAQQFTERFEREARAIASLNHTNICHLYDVGPNYLVMELVEGETLAGPLRFEDALPILRQLIDGIEAAHERNIVHRDLKPANIKITHDGVVKILDFGLAKALAPEPEANPETSPTLTMGATEAGTLLGTAAYMSPEQARGKPADKRADVWSFGVVVYELLTGKRPFQGESVVDTLGAVLNREPDWSPVPPGAQRLLKWCLEKDRKQRLQSIGDARRVVEEAGETAKPAAPPPRFPVSAWIIAGVLALALAALAFVHFREQPAEAALTRFQIPLPPNENFPNRFVPQQISPDGSKLAFETAGPDRKVRLWIRSFDSLDARPVPEVDPVAAPIPVIWSPDSRYIAFQSADQKLKKITVAGGPAQTLCDLEALSAGSWSRDGVIVYGEPRGIFRVPDSGGTPVQLTSLDRSRHERSHFFPRFLPDNRRFLYIRESGDSVIDGIYVGSIDAQPAAQSSKPLLSTDGLGLDYVSASASNTGWLLFTREGSVMAQRFNPSKLELSGDAIPVAEGVGRGLTGMFSVSRNGILVYAPAGQSGKSQLTWFDREGKNPVNVGDPADYLNAAALSRDGNLAAVTILEPQSDRQLNMNLWLIDFSRGGAFSKFTLDRSFGQWPVFSYDSTQVVFSSLRPGGTDLYRKPANGQTDEELLLQSDEPKVPLSWSRDGRYLLYIARSPKSKNDLWILPMDASRKPGTPVLFQGTEADESEGRFSPDGHWIAYTSEESGRNEVYVREFSPGPDGKPLPTGKHQISTGGGSKADWGIDGKELIFLAPDRTTLLSAAIATTPVFRASAPRTVFKLPAATTIAPLVSADGKRILVALPAHSAQSQLIVIQNWQEILKK